MPRVVLPSSGSSIYVEETGRGRPVLAVHGLGGGAWFFSGIARRLAEDCRVIAVDLPGTGRSGAGGEISMARWADDLGDLTASVIKEPVVFLGHSMGTILGLHAAARWPDLLRGLIFAGGLPEPLPHIRERLASRAEAVEREGMVGTGEAVAAANFAPSSFRRVPEIVALFERLFETQDAATYARCCRVLAAAAGTPPVSGVRVPAISISGREDSYAPPREVERFLQDLPGSTLELLSDCGHFPFLEQPSVFAEHVRAFVRRVW